MENENSILKSLHGNGINSQDTSKGNEPFFNEDESNSELTSNIITLGHLRIYLNLKYPSLRKAGQVAELSHSRMKQIVTAKYLPQSPTIIYRISKAWSIDPVKLTQLFEKYRDRLREDVQKDEKKGGVPAA